MTLHIGEVNSQVEVTGLTAAADAAARGRPRPPGWEELARLRTLLECEERDRLRTAGEGFDG